MAKEFFIASNTLTKKETYNLLYSQMKALLDGEKDTIANMGNFCAAIKQTFHFLWVGFYFVKNDELVLGSFQGPVACTRIQKGKGVCGQSWEKNQTLIVPNVDEFPGHIACSSLSKSEIVIPILKNNTVIGVLDIDSENLNTFDQTDETYLKELLLLLSFDKN